MTEADIGELPGERAVSDDWSVPGRRLLPARLEWRGWPAHVPYLLAGGFFLLYTLLSSLRFWRYDTHTWDIAIFEAALRQYAHFNPPIVDIKGPGFNLLGDHFHPVIALLAPVYRLFPSPYTLLVAQAALIAFSVVPVTRAATSRLGKAAGLAAGLAYGAAWGLQRAVDFEWHEIAFAVPILALVMERLLAERWRPAALWALPLLLVKEEFGLTVAAIGGYLCWRRQWKPGAALVLLGLAATPLLVFVVMPAINGGQYEYWHKLGAGAGEGTTFRAAIGMFAARPWQFFLPLSVKLETLWMLLLPTGGLALFSPMVLLVLPTLLWRFISADPHYWGTEYQYNAILMPILFMAFIDGIQRARASARPLIRTYARRHAVTVVVTVAVMLCGSMPFRDLVRASSYQSSPRADAAHAVLDQIPDGSSVESDVGLLNRLTSCCRVYFMGRMETAPPPDFIVFDLQAGGWDRLEDGDVEGWARAAHPGVTYTRVMSREGYVLLRRVSPQ